MAPFFTEGYPFTESEKKKFYDGLKAVGGSLTFTLHQDAEGWTAQCNEVDGIIASDTNPNPTSEEIESGIREAIYAAFDLKLSIQKPFFSYTPIKVVA